MNPRGPRIDRAALRASILAVIAKHRCPLSTSEVAEHVGHGRHLVASMLAELEREGLYQRKPNCEPAHRLRPGDLDLPARVLAERLGVTERTVRRYRSRASTPPADSTGPVPGRASLDRTEVPR